MSVTAASILDTSPFITTDPLNLSTNPISIFALLVAKSAAIIAASPGVIVKIPIAFTSLFESPIFFAKSFWGFAIIEIGFVDRFSGSVVINGDVSSIEAAVTDIMEYFKNTLRFSVTEITRS